MKLLHSKNGSRLLGPRHYCRGGCLIRYHYYAATGITGGDTTGVTSGATTGVTGGAAAGVTDGAAAGVTGGATVGVCCIVSNR